VAAQIVETLETFLRKPDSPLLKEQLDFTGIGLRPPAPPVRPQPIRAQNPRGSNNRSGACQRASPVQHATPVCQLTAEHIESISNREDCVPQLAAAESEASDPMQELHNELVNMETPADIDSLCAHVLCAAAIRCVGTDNVNSPPHCIVCNGHHRFDQCKVPNNTNFLRLHCIRFCQQVCQDAAARSLVLNNDSDAAPTAPVNFMEHNLNSCSEDMDEDEEQDFQTGRH